jgi:hypothetical protein
MKMEILSFEGSNGSSKRKRGKNFVAVATIVALGFMGSTFAASVTLNGGSNVEYGQGVSSAVACASDLIVTPANSFNGTFNLETITVVDSSSVTTAANAGLGNCIGDKILVKAYNNSNVVQFSCDVSITGFSTVLTVAANGALCPNGTITAVSGAAGTNDGFAIRNSGTAVPAANIYKITLESHN